MKKHLLAAVSSLAVAGLVACGGGDDGPAAPANVKLYTTDGTTLSSFSSLERMKKHLLAAVSSLAVAGLVACGGGDDGPAAPANVKLYTTDGTTLSSFSSLERLTATNTAITGLNAGTSIVAMDMNPNQGALVALGSDGQVYTVDPSTGAATNLGNRDTAATFANRFVDMDFNPRAQNVFRVATTANDNYRQRGNVPANSTAPTAAPGARVAADTPFAYVTGDRNAGKTPAVAALAYNSSSINNAVLPASTTVWVIDTANDVLARLGGAPADGAACPNATNPNCGQLTTIGSLGLDLSGTVGFDIQSNTNSAFVTAVVGGDERLYTINLTTGAMTDNGVLPPSTGDVKAFAVQQ